MKAVCFVFDTDYGAVTQRLPLGIAAMRPELLNGVLCQRERRPLPARTARTAPPPDHNRLQPNLNPAKPFQRRRSLLKPSSPRGRRRRSKTPFPSLNKLRRSTSTAAVVCAACAACA